MTVTVRYQPANTAADLPPGSRYQAMDAFLLSDQLAGPVMEAGRAIAADAKALYIAEAFDTGQTANSVFVSKGVAVIAGNPRVIARVGANGGIPAGMKEDVSVAVLIEFGKPGLRILGRAGAPYDNPKVVG